jgi:hypothetical protein
MRCPSRCASWTSTRTTPERSPDPCRFWADALARARSDALARAGGGARRRFGGSVGLSGRLPCGARPRRPAAELASLTAFAALKQRRQACGRGALRARSTCPVRLGAPQARQHAPPPAPGLGRPPEQPPISLRQSISERAGEGGDPQSASARQASGRACGAPRSAGRESPARKRASSSISPPLSERSAPGARIEFGGGDSGSSTAGQPAQRAGRSTEAPRRLPS